MEQQKAVIEEMLKHVTEVALKRPDEALMFISDCTSTLAMNQFPQHLMHYFEQQTSTIMDIYIGNTMPNIQIQRDNRYTH